MNDATNETKPTVPFHVQAAKASWIAPLVGIAVFSMVGKDAKTQEVRFAVACMAGAIYTIGLIFAVWAIVGAFQKGPRKNLIPASIGLLVNGLIVFAFVGAIVTGRQHAQQAKANTRHVDVDHGPPPAVDAPWGGLKTHINGTPVARAELAVVLLHGYGAPGNDLVALGDVITPPTKTAFLFPEGPIALEQGGRAWYYPSGQGLEETRQRLHQLIADITRTSPDCDIVLGGFSQGAILASNLLGEAEHSRLKGVILYSPAFDLTHPPTEQQTKPHILIAHGRSDQILRFSESEKLRKELESRGFEITWVPFEGGHTISLQAIEATSKFLNSFR